MLKQRSDVGLNLSAELPVTNQGEGKSAFIEGAQKGWKIGKQLEVNQEPEHSFMGES